MAFFLLVSSPVVGRDESVTSYALRMAVRTFVRTTVIYVLKLIVSLPVPLASTTCGKLRIDFSTNHGFWLLRFPEPWQTKSR